MRREPELGQVRLRREDKKHQRRGVPTGGTLAARHAEKNGDILENSRGLPIGGFGFEQAVTRKSWENNGRARRGGKRNWSIKGLLISKASTGAIITGDNRGRGSSTIFPQATCKGKMKNLQTLKKKDDLESNGMRVDPAGARRLLLRAGERRRPAVGSPVLLEACSGKGGERKVQKAQDREGTTDQRVTRGRFRIIGSVTGGTVFLLRSETN